MKEFIKNIDWLGLCVLIMLLLSFWLIIIYVHKEEEVEKAIIKQSEEYVIFKECTKIQGKYYCK
mgnify:CR=1 FL=1